MSPRFSIRPLAKLADHRLAELAAAGDERAFEALIGRHRVALERYCWRLGLPDHRAEDVLQQAFTRAWVALRGGSDVGQPRAWLYRIVHNAALNAHRSARLRSHESIDAPVVGSLALARTDDTETRLLALETLKDLAALPQMQRQAVVMTAIQGRSHEETAGELGLSDGAVRGLLHRARKKLRTAAAALSPQGLFELLARLSSGGTLGGPPLEAGAGAAGAGLAGVLAKGAAVTVVTGLLAGGAVTQLEHDRSDARHAAAAGTAGASSARAASAVQSARGAVPSRPPADRAEARRSHEDGRGPRHGRGGSGQDSSRGRDVVNGQRFDAGRGRGGPPAEDVRTVSSRGDGGQDASRSSGSTGTSSSGPGASGNRSGDGSPDGGVTRGGQGSSGGGSGSVSGSGASASLQATDAGALSSSGGHDGSGFSPDG